jgi:hypothetical protein
VESYFADTRSASLAAAKRQERKGVARGQSRDQAKSDEVLLACTQEGDREALAELFRNYAKSIRSIGVRILRDGMEADDLVQEVFLYLYRKSSLFDCSKGSARSWIFQIA